MGYGFYPNIPNNQVGVEINNNIIRIIQARYSGYSMKIEGMDALNLVNSKVVKTHINTRKLSRDDFDVQRILSFLPNELSNSLKILSQINTDKHLCFFDFTGLKNSNIPDLHRSGIQYYPNGYNVPALMDRVSHNSGYNKDLPTFVIDQGASFGHYGSVRVITALNSSGLAFTAGIGNPTQQTAGILYHILATGFQIAYSCLSNIEIVTSITDTTKPPYGLQINISNNEACFYPNSAVKISNSGNHLIVPKHSNFDFNNGTVNGQNYSNKVLAISGNVSSNILVDL